MADLLSVGTSGIKIYQRSLATVANNIANVDTEGYSRQSHETEQMMDAGSATVKIGLGVSSASVRRAYDSFATETLRKNTSSLEQQNSLYDYARKLENILGDSQLSVTTILDRFFSAAQDLSVSPSSASARESLLNEARNVSERFQSMARQFDQLDTDSFLEIDSKVSSLNTLAKQLAAVNQSLYKNGEVSKQPNALLDQRDDLLQQMSELTQITVTEKQSGVVDVYLGFQSPDTGMVVGETSKLLSAKRLDSDQERVGFVLDAYGSPKAISSITSGSLAGIQDFRNNALQQARGELDALALGFMNAVNAVQQSGWDSSGNYGQAMFGVADQDAHTASQISVLISGGDSIATASPLFVNQESSVSTLKLSGWSTVSQDTLRVGESSITTKLSSDQTLTVGGSSSNISRAFVIEGNKTRDLDLTFNNASGVQIFTRDGRHLFGDDTIGSNTNFLSSLLTESNGFNSNNVQYNGDYLLNGVGTSNYKDALSTYTDGTNTHFKIDGQLAEDLVVFVTNGSSTFSGNWYPESADLTKQQLLSNIEVSFTSANSFSLTDLATGTVIAERDYKVGDLIEVNGWSASMVNNPVAGDKFTIGANTSPAGDNRNVLKLAELQSNRDIFSGRGTLGEVYADVINDLGSVVVQAQISRDAQSVLTDEAKQQRDSVSAVSLDEEAANLLRFQQAYQANAQVIQAANRLFDVILQIR
jgi:flagellar hook-associated protein 1 FlgK